MTAFSWRTTAWLLISTVLLPAVASVSVGILILVFYREAWDVASGVLVLCFAVFAVIGSLITVFLLRKVSHLTRLQAEFIARMSHDFRTPLTAIKLFVETLRAGKVDDPAEQARCLDVLARETERMERLVEHVLSWRSIDSKGPLLEAVTPEAPEELIRAALAPYIAELDPASAKRIEVVIEPRLPQVVVERDSIVEALRNLVQNALKYSSEAVIVSVRFDKGIVFSVRDSGEPIPRKARRQIFHRFYRAPGTRVAGSGLGLTISRRIAEVHGGSLELEVSQVGNTFVLRLPSVVVVELDQTSPSPPRASAPSRAEESP